MKEETDLQKRDYIGNDTESPRERGRMIRQSCASFSILRPGLQVPWLLQPVQYTTIILFLSIVAVETPCCRQS